MIVECDAFNAHLYHTAQLKFSEFLFSQRRRNWVYGSEERAEAEEGKPNFRVDLAFELRPKELLRLQKFLLIKRDVTLDAETPLNGLTLGDIMPHGRDYYKNDNAVMKFIALNYCAGEFKGEYTHTYPGKLCDTNFTLVCTSLPMAKFAIAMGSILRAFSYADKHFLLFRTAKGSFVPLGEIPLRYQKIVQGSGIDSTASIEQQSVPLNPESAFYKYFSACEIVDKDFKITSTTERGVVIYESPQVVLTAKAEARKLCAGIAGIDWATARAMCMDEYSAKIMVRVTECELIRNTFHLIQWLPRRCCYLVVWTPPLNAVFEAQKTTLTSTFTKKLFQQAGVFCTSFRSTPKGDIYDFSYETRLSTYLAGNSVPWYRSVSIVSYKSTYRLNFNQAGAPYNLWNETHLPPWQDLLKYLRKLRNNDLQTSAIELEVNPTSKINLMVETADDLPVFFFQTWLEVYRSVEHNPPMSQDKDCDSCAYCHNVLQLHSPFFPKMSMTLFQQNKEFVAQCTVFTLDDDDFDLKLKEEKKEIRFKVKTSSEASPVRATQEALLEWCTQCTWTVMGDPEQSLKSFKYVIVELIKRHGAVPIIGPHQELTLQSNKALPENVLPLMLPKDKQPPETLYYSVR